MANTKRILKWTAGTVVALASAGSIGYLWYCGYFLPGNGREYSVAQTPPLPSSPLAGKTLLFLGSSVTVGFASHNESFVDYLRQRDGCVCVKEAKSGTTLADNGSSSYVQRFRNFDPHAQADAFVCQLSTNDTRWYGLKRLGRISPSTNPQDFDRTTTTGAMEYLIATARATWHCPVIFYTNSYFQDEHYPTLIKRLYELKSKWGIEVIDLYDNKEMNKASPQQLDLYMLRDQVHPLRAGYKLWWTPVIEQQLYAILGKK